MEAGRPLSYSCIMLYGEPCGTYSICDLEPERGAAPLRLKSSTCGLSMQMRRHGRAARYVHHHVECCTPHPRMRPPPALLIQTPRAPVAWRCRILSSSTRNQDPKTLWLQSTSIDDQLPHQHLIGGHIEIFRRAWRCLYITALCTIARA